MLTRAALLRRSPGPIDTVAKKRRRKGGKLAVGRNSGTRESLLRERAYVFERAAGRCELCRFLPDYDSHPPTDFTHCPPRSQPGSADDRFHAVAACNRANLAMQGPYSKDRALVTPVTVKGVRGFDIEWVRAAGKIAYRLGDYVTLGAGFVAAECAKISLAKESPVR